MFDYWTGLLKSYNTEVRKWVLSEYRGVGGYMNQTSWVVDRLKDKCHSPLRARLAGSLGREGAEHSLRKTLVPWVVPARSDQTCTPQWSEQDRACLSLSTLITGPRSKTSLWPKAAQWGQQEGNWEEKDVCSCSRVLSGQGQLQHLTTGGPWMPRRLWVVSVQPGLRTRRRQNLKEGVKRLLFPWNGAA